MTRIRPDLVGVVIVRDANWQPVILSAGDTVPDDALDQVGDHVLDEAKPAGRRQPKSE